MSYPRDLEDYADWELLAEINKRNKYRLEDKCDYCGSNHPDLCSKPVRHINRKIITIE